VNGARRQSTAGDAARASGAARANTAVRVSGAVARGGRAGEGGQASVLLVGALVVLLLGAFVLDGVARGVGVHGERQRAADLAALAGGHAMHAAYPRLFEPAVIDGRPNARHLPVAAYRALGERAALETARRNGARDVAVTLPDGASFAPVRIRVTVRDGVDVGGRHLRTTAVAEAELAPPDAVEVGPLSGDEYRGPFAHRQGKPMRPDVARAFDRLEAAARRAGLALVIASAFRSNAEQARLFAQRPDPRWVAPPGRSLHRLGTELDLGPPDAYGWLAANAPRFGFRKRYSWEPWHFGYVRNPGTRSVGYGPPDGRRALPSFVPARYAPAIARAAQRHNVSAALLAAQLYAESNFNPNAVSPAGARGIAQFMPGTAARYGLTDPHDATQAIDAQARLMRDLLRQFGSVPLALAAYNAGPGAVARCACIPPYPETRGYVARILGLLGGAGEGPSGGGLAVRLVR